MMTATMPQRTNPIADVFAAYAGDRSDAVRAFEKYVYDLAMERGCDLNRDAEAYAWLRVVTRLMRDGVLTTLLLGEAIDALWDAIQTSQTRAAEMKRRVDDARWSMAPVLVEMSAAQQIERGQMVYRDDDGNARPMRPDGSAVAPMSASDFMRSMYRMADARIVVDGVDLNGKVSTIPAEGAQWAYSMRDDAPAGPTGPLFDVIIDQAYVTAGVLTPEEVALIRSLSPNAVIVPPVDSDERARWFAEGRRSYEAACRGVWQRRILAALDRERARPPITAADLRDRLFARPRARLALADGRLGPQSYAPVDPLPLP